MMTVERIAGQTDGRSSEFRGLSTDTKPMTANGKDVENGSTFLELDTSKVYGYSKSNDTWYEL